MNQLTYLGTPDIKEKTINFRQASCQRRFPWLDAMGTYGNAETKTLWAAETATAAGQCYSVFVEAQPIYAHYMLHVWHSYPRLGDS